MARKLKKQPQNNKNEPTNQMKEDRRVEKNSVTATKHKEQLLRLEEKDPEFYQFLQTHDKELLEFNENDAEDDVSIVENAEIQVDDERGNQGRERREKKVGNIITTESVESWIRSLREGNLRSLPLLLRAFRTACHCGGEDESASSTSLNIVSSNVFNKIMLFVLSEMDGILRRLLRMPSSGGNKETLLSVMQSKQWQKYSRLVKLYLSNALHILNQMTDVEMIAYTLRRLKYSSVFLGAFPSFIRKYIKVALHFWGAREGALPIVSFLFLRDLCIIFEHDCLDTCLKGIYKAYVVNCRFVNATSLQHIHFLGNCVVELLGINIQTSYQHAFVYIRQIGMILRDGITRKTKESFLKVYEWKFMNCLDLWTRAICAYSSDVDMKRLSYPLAQIITGVARLLPVARYLPLRLRCIQMLNQISSSTRTFIPVSMILLDMLEMKEFHMTPTGGFGKIIDFRTILKVSKIDLRTRAFQEACVFSVVEELAEHLAQWSNSISFFELSFIPVVRMRSFCKNNKIDRFNKEMRQLIQHIEANCEYVKKHRLSVTHVPNSNVASSFLMENSKACESPLSQYASILHNRTCQRNESMVESSLIVGEHKVPDGVIDDDAENNQGATIFSSSWLPRSEPLRKTSKEKKKRKMAHQPEVEDGLNDDDSDVVEDLVLSSDEDHSAPTNQRQNPTTLARNPNHKKQKLSRPTSAKPNTKFSATNSRCNAKPKSGLLNMKSL